MQVKATTSVDVSTSASVLYLVPWPQLSLSSPLIVSLRRLLSSPLSEYVEKVVEVPVEKIVEKTVEKIGA